MDDSKITLTIVSKRTLHSLHMTEKRLRSLHGVKNTKKNKEALFMRYRHDRAYDHRSYRTSGTPVITAVL